MNILGVIPARGGSKGVPRKNLRALGGKPLLAHSIEAARASKGLTRVVVSTEDEEITLVAKAHGSEVVQRPAELARDDSLTEPVLLHAVDQLAAEGFRADAVATLEPASPLRSARLIDACVGRLLRGDCDAVLTVVETRACYGRLLPGDRFEHLVPGQPRRRQLRQPLYEESSAVYVTLVDALRRAGSVLGTNPVAVVAEAAEAIDINTELDLAIAEGMLAHRRSKERP